MWKPIIKYNKPTISPTHHRKDIKILARVVLRVFLKGRKPYNRCVFSVYTGGSVIEASEDKAILKVELDEYFTGPRLTDPTTLFIFERGEEFGSYSCRHIKQKHRLETLDHKLFLSSSLLLPKDSVTEDTLTESEDIVATVIEKELGERATKRASRKYLLGEIKLVIELFQPLREAGFDDSKIYQKIVSTLGYDLDRVKEIIHYYKAAYEDRHFAVYDDFTIYDATLCWLDDPEEYCRRNQYPLWQP